MELAVEKEMGDNSNGNKVKKTRRKLIKSCAFCRKRKLRCDQRKPMCTTCLKRGFASCVYPVNNTPKDQSNAGYVNSTVSNAALLQRISDLEQQLREVQGTCNTKDKNILPVVNPLRKLFHLQYKKSGRAILYGPTSARTFIINSNWFLSGNFQQLWCKVKIERSRLKQKTGNTTLRENCLIEEPLNLVTSPYVNPTTIIEEACNALPTYETILKKIQTFFENKELYEINETLDEDKVFKDFKEAFVAGPVTSISSERLIVSLIPSEKKNYYRIGVIVAILQLTYYRSNIPPAIGRFLVFLHGLSTGKVMYIERIQVHLLRIFYRTTYGFGGDSSHTMILTNSMIQESVHFGLNHNIRAFFKDKEGNVGKLETLEKLWCWILVADFDVAFYMGSPPKLTSQLIFDDECFDDRSSTFYGFLKRFLSLVRPMLLSMFDKSVIPDLQSYCELIVDFIDVEFPPIWYLTEGKRIEEMSMCKTRFLCHLLSMLLAFYGLRFLAFGERSPQLKNGVLVSSMVSFSVSINLLKFSHQQDKKFFPEMLQEVSRGLSPYLTQAVSIVGRLFVRSLSMFYGFAYHKLTLFESGVLVAKPDMHGSLCDLKSLRVQPGAHISFLQSFEMFRDMFDELIKDTQLRMILLRSHALTIIFTMERVGRTIMDKVLEYRTIAENTWISQFRKDLDSGGLVDVEFKENSQITVSTDQNFPTPRSGPDALDSNVASSVNLTKQEKKVAGQETELADLISEDFWANYNVGWEEFMSNADYNELFSDFITNE